MRLRGCVCALNKEMESSSPHSGIGKNQAFTFCCYFLASCEVRRRSRNGQFTREIRPHPGALVFDHAANPPTAFQNCRQHFQQTPWFLLIVVVWVAVALQGRLMAHAQKLAQGS